MLGKHFVLVILHHNLELVLSKTSRIGDTNELLGAKGLPLVGEEVRKKETGKVGS